MTESVYSLDPAYDDDIKKFGHFKDRPALRLKSILRIGVSTNPGAKKVEFIKDPPVKCVTNFKVIL